MKKIKIISLLFTIAVVASCSKRPDLDDSKQFNLKEDFAINDTLENVNSEIAHVVFLFGQSNATGYTETRGLMDKDPVTYELYQNGFDNVYINYNCDNFRNYSNEFVKCKFGQGVTPNHFGPECGMAEAFSKAFPNKKTFIVKYAYGGCSLGTQWLNGYSERGGLYNCSLKMCKLSLEYLKSKGYKVNIEGICWMQGESDAYWHLENYYENTKNMVKFYRSDFSVYDKSIEFVDACIDDSGQWLEHDRINNDKLKFSKESEHNHLIDTCLLGFKTTMEPIENPDLCHYDSIYMAELGRQFATSIVYNNYR